MRFFLPSLSSPTKVGIQVTNKFLSMKKLLPILFLTSLLLSACNFNWSNKEDLFQKKQECIKLEKDMWEQLNSNERYWNRMESTTLYLTIIFYSPIRNSCIYKSEFIVWDSYQLELNDFFTKEVIYDKLCLKWGTQYSDCSSDFENKIKELKWE